jgi:hypothetical protein
VERTLLSAAFDFDFAFDLAFDFAFDLLGRTRTRGCPILARSVRKGGIPRTLRFGF